MAMTDEEPAAHDNEDPDMDPNETAASPASPPCFAAEVDPGYFDAAPPLVGEELLALLNRLLAAERAGAKVIGQYLQGMEASTLRRVLQNSGHDEGRYCVMLREQIERLGGTPTQETGDFYDKAIRIEGLEERLTFLNRGQGWVARELTKALPRVRERELNEALTEMRDTHIVNIRTCTEAAGLE